MNIAYFTDTYLPQLNGVSLSIQLVITELRKRGHRVFVFAPEIKGHKDEDEDIIRLKSFKVLSSEPEVFFPMLVPNKNYRKVMSLKFDLIHAHGNGAFSLLGYEVAQMRGIPYILTFHNLHTKYTHYIFKGKVITPKMVAAAMRVFGNICDGVVTPSVKMKHELLSFGIKKQIEVIPNPIENEKFLVEKKDFLRKKFSIPKNDPVVLSVGRLGKEKNFSFLIRAFSKVVKKHPNAHFVLVGIGPERKNLESLSGRLKLGKNMHFAGKIDYEEMPLTYLGADIFVFASQTETQGMVVLEAAAAGLPLIVADDSVFDNIVTGKNGFSLPLLQRNFVEKLVYLLENPEIGEKMGAASREIAQKRYNREAIIDHLVSYYSYILSTSSTRKRKRRIFSDKSLRIFLRASNIVEKIFK